MNYHFETTMLVRDYECDLQGIVNNANYLHYCEHTRHLFLRKCGLSFAEMHDMGEDAVVARMKLEYKVPLRSEDAFASCLWIEKAGVRYVFHHDIYKLGEDQENDRQLCFRAKVDVVCLVNGVLAESEQCNEAFKEYLED